MAPPRSAITAKLQKDQDDLLPSEDEDDEDFTLEDGEGDDGGSDSSDSEREQGPVSKRAKVETVPAEPVLDKSAVDDLWASFNDPTVDPYASTSTLTSTSTPSRELATTAPTAANRESLAAASDTKKGKAKANLDHSDLVTIKVTYKFAGDTVTQDKKVPRDSQEARDYFALHPEPARASASSASSSAIDALFGSSDASSATTGDQSSSSASPAVSTSASNGTSAGKPPPPKRKRVGAGGGLGAMAASLGVGGAKKLNTLEKSKLDWNSYVQTQDGLEDTLQHARKDGYLEKKDFLDRVEMRKEEGWEKGRKKGGR